MGIGRLGRAACSRTCQVAVNIEGKFAGLEVGYDVPAIPGMSEDEIQTPCLILDLDALERNVRKMGDYARAHNMRHRAHGKMHKSIDVLRLQQELGGNRASRSILAGSRTWFDTSTSLIPAPAKTSASETFWQTYDSLLLLRRQMQNRTKIIWFRSARCYSNTWLMPAPTLHGGTPSFAGNLCNQVSYVRQRPRDPLYPRKRTSTGASSTSALCQRETFAKEKAPANCRGFRKQKARFRIYSSGAHDVVGEMGVAGHCSSPLVPVSRCKWLARRATE
jgi:hypothetical protein